MQKNDLTTEVAGSFDALGVNSHLLTHIVTTAIRDPNIRPLKGDFSEKESTFSKKLADTYTKLIRAAEWR